MSSFLNQFNIWSTEYQKTVKVPITNHCFKTKGMIGLTNSPQPKDFWFTTTWGTDKKQNLTHFFFLIFFFHPQCLEIKDGLRSPLKHWFRLQIQIQWGFKAEFYQQLTHLSSSCGWSIGQSVSWELTSPDIYVRTLWTKDLVLMACQPLTSKIKSYNRPLQNTIPQTSTLFFKPKNTYILAAR